MKRVFFLSAAEGMGFCGPWRAFWLAVFVVLGLGLCACDKPPRASFPPISRLFPETKPLHQPQERSAFVSVDGTLSMQGFAKVPGSSYTETLHSLDRAVNQLAGMSRVTYRKFGSELAGIGPNEPLYVAASRSVFYSGTGSYATTRADIALKKAGNSDLVILITDLFQDQSDVLAIERSVEELGFPGSKSIAIWQWELPFDGTIYDYDVRGSRGARYQGPRPLYFFAVASEPILRELSTTLRQTSILPPTQFLAISSNFLKNRNSWLRVTQLIGLALSERISGPVPVSVMRIRSGCSSAELSASSMLEQSGFGLELDPHKAAVSSENTSANLDEVIRDNKAPKLQAVSSALVELTKINGETPSVLKVRFDCDAVAAKELYVLTVKRTAAVNDVAIPSWVYTSDATTGSLTQGLSRAEKDWGNKTLDLLPLVRDLTSIAISRGPIATQYFFVLRSD